MRMKKIIKKFYQEEINSIVYKNPRLPHIYLQNSEIQESSIFKKLFRVLCLNIFILIIGLIGLSNLKSDKYSYLTIEFLNHQTSEVRNKIINNFQFLSEYFENKNLQ